MKSNNTDLALYYERVSTQHEQQDESMENQRALVESYLKRHPNIKLAEPIDTYSERVSGKSDVRPKYQKLLERLEKGDIAYVLIKDFKRINRSTELSAQLKNYAKEYGFKFILLSTGQIFDPNADENRMMYGFESLVNEEVVYRQSEYGRLAHRQKCESKRLNRNNVTFGFDWDTEKGDIIIHPERSELIKGMFERYVFLDYGMQEIRKYFADNGYFYSANTISKWLQETAYIGVFHLNKKGSELGVGSGKKTKRFMNPKDEWVAVERKDLAFIDEELFALAQRIRESRIRHFDATKLDGKETLSKQGRFRGTHLFSAKIYCAECGYPLVHGYADRKKQIGIYRDSYNARAKNPLEKCPNVDFKRLYEEDLIEIVCNTINEIVMKHKHSFPMLLEAIEKVLETDCSQKIQIKEKEKEIARLKQTAKAILDKFTIATGPLLTDLNEKYNEIQVRITQLSEEIVALQSLESDKLDIREQIKVIQDRIEKWSIITKDTLDRKTVETFIKKMLVSKDGVLQILLKTDVIVSTQVEKQEKNRKGSSSVFSVYPTKNKDYITQIRKVMESIVTRKEKISQIAIVSFDYHSQKGGKQINVDVQIEVFIGKANNS